MATFFFDFRQGDSLEEDDLGILLEIAEEAYLEAYGAAAAMWRNGQTRRALGRHQLGLGQYTFLPTRLADNNPHGSRQHIASRHASTQAISALRVDIGANPHLGYDLI